MWEEAKFNPEIVSFICKWYNYRDCSGIFYVFWALVRISYNSQFLSINIKSSSIFQRLSLVSLLCIYLNERNVLTVCPREHRTVVLHAISPISIKLCQFKGSTPKLKKTGFCFGFFQGKIDNPRFFLVFTKEIASK